MDHRREDRASRRLVHTRHLLHHLGGEGDLPAGDGASSGPRHDLVERVLDAIGVVERAGAKGGLERPIAGAGSVRLEARAGRGVDGLRRQGRSPSAARPPAVTPATSSGKPVRSESSKSGGGTSALRDRPLRFTHTTFSPAARAPLTSSTSLSPTWSTSWGGSPRSSRARSNTTRSGL